MAVPPFDGALQETRRLARLATATVGAAGRPGFSFGAAHASPHGALPAVVLAHTRTA